MKIRKIEFKGHPILGYFTFDFLIKGSVCNFALIVSENGCGKTALLEEIHKILSKGFRLWNDGINRKITLEFTEQEKNELEVPVNVIIFDYDETRSSQQSWSRFRMFDLEENDITSELLPKIQNDSSLNKILKCAYSTVEINFNKKDIEFVKASTIDDEDSAKNKSSNELATEIAQLLVDIKNQDNSEKAIYFDGGKSNSDIRYEGKFDRFKKAYAKMFDGKEMLDVRVENNKYHVIFRDYKKEVDFDISGLSSGEKQVVYRVGYLLKNLRGLNNGVALIDEPELSLHPKWQERYLQFLREVFSNNESVNMQFVIATHSPLLLKGSLDQDVSVHILRRDEQGVIFVTNIQEKGFGLLKWSPSWGEICYFAYDLSTIEFHDDLYSTIEDSLKNNPHDRIKQKDFESYVKQKKPNTTIVKWLNPNMGPKEETIMTYVRNRTHHPDNQDRPKLAYGQLEEAIQKMLDLIQNP
jgi:predicted ATP-binding protein involved in virulence